MQNAEALDLAMRGLSDKEKAELITLLGALSNPAHNIIMQTGPGQRSMLKGDGQRLLLWAQSALGVVFNMNADKLAAIIMQNAPGKQ